MNIIGPQIRRLRELNNMTQEELAAVCLRIVEEHFWRIDLKHLPVGASRVGGIVEIPVGVTEKSPFGGAARPATSVVVGPEPAGTIGGTAVC